MLFQPKGMRMSSESERSSPLPDPAEIARRAERQRSLYEEAAENPDRVVPAMFIEDCARCETLADKRRREGFYKHFYRTLPDRETAELSSDDLPRRFSLLRPSILQSMIRLLRTKARTWPPFRSYGSRSVLVNTRVSCVKLRWSTISTVRTAISTQNQRGSDSAMVSRVRVQTPAIGQPLRSLLLQ